MCVPLREGARYRLCKSSVFTCTRAWKQPIMRAMHVPTSCALCVGRAIRKGNVYMIVHCVPMQFSHQNNNIPKSSEFDL
jgi:hypothetical protein